MYHMCWEVPQSEVDPTRKHDHVPNHLYCEGCYVNCEFENAASKICYIVKHHDCCSHWQIVQHIGEKDQGKCQEVMKEIL